MIAFPFEFQPLPLIYACFQLLRGYAITYISILYAVTYSKKYTDLGILYSIRIRAYLYAEGPDMNQQIARTEKQLGAILRRARKQAGLTQSGLGKNIHLRQATVSRLEAGEPAIQLRTVMEALAALNLELVVRPRSQASAADIENVF
jgi:HTH-type transcriptional regulator/antitoxin HipB